jgi:hypothetical protein
MSAKFGYAAVAILLPVAVVTQTAFGGELVLSVDKPVVTVETRSAGRNFMRLPTVDYLFDIRPICSAGMLPRSLSLSIADTRVVLTGDKFNGEAAISVSVRVPADQIAPIALKDFCAAPAAAEAMASRTIHIPGILSVQASLRCENVETSEVVYASRALDVALSCGAEEAGAKSGSDESVGTR